MPYTADPYDDTTPTGATLALYLDEEIRAAKGALIDHRTRIVAVETTVATETVTGRVELASAAETVTGTDGTRATHSAGVKAAMDARINAVAAFTCTIAPGAVLTKTADLRTNVALSGAVFDAGSNYVEFTAAFSGLPADLLNSPRNFVIVGSCNGAHGLSVQTVPTTTSLVLRARYETNAPDAWTHEFNCTLYMVPAA
jgi:hypothetical protein